MQTPTRRFLVQGFWFLVESGFLERGSRSSRLLHGGLRYLAQGRLGLVREASREKLVLRQIAPHLAEPLPFLFPTYKGTHWPRWKLSLGVRLYDFLCGQGNLGRSSTLSREQTLALLKETPPALPGLSGAVRYFDGLTNDARLVLDTLRSAAKHGALVCNYLRFENAEPDSDGWRCSLREVVQASGLRRNPEDCATSEIAVRARCVASAAGPWAGGLARNNIPLRLTKGAHLVVARERLNIPEAIVMAEGRRILFAIPWGRRVILGTTDTDFNASAVGQVSPPVSRAGTIAPPSPIAAPPDPIAEVAASPEDTRYILGVVNGAFPEAKLRDSDVLSAWAGLRPLIGAGAPQGTPSDVSRSHVIRMVDPGWLEIAGGKLTTYRLMAEQAVERIAAHLGRRIQPSRTADEPLLDESETDGISAIVPPPPSRGLVRHFCRNEWALYLDDILARRGNWLHYCDDRTEVAKQTAHWMAEECGWDAARERAEIRRAVGGKR